MSKWAFLWFAATVQALFLLATLLFLLLTRFRRWREDQEDAYARARLAELIRRGLLGEGAVEELVHVLTSLRRRTAVRQLIGISGGRLSDDLRHDLAARLHDTAWIRETLQLVESRWWWRRLEAARVLAAVADERDAPVVERVLLDRHAAVASAATAALGRAVNERLVEVVLNALHLRPAPVRAQQYAALRRHWELVTPILVRRLRETRDAARLRVLIDLAEALDSPAATPELLHAVDHAAVEVRVAVARALGKSFSAEAVVALRRLLADGDWRVRAQAARALGLLNATSAVAHLADALTDNAWWVRFRAALALAGLGEAGRAALRRARGSSDAYARDMATFVSGLSEGSRIELSAR